MWREKGGRRWGGCQQREGGGAARRTPPLSIAGHRRPSHTSHCPFILCPGPGSIQAVPLGKCHGLGTLSPGECTGPRAPHPPGPCAWDRAHRVGVRVRVRVRGRGVGRMAAERAAEAVLEDVTRFHFPCPPASRLDSGRLNPLHTSTQHAHQTHAQLDYTSCTCPTHCPIRAPCVSPHSFIPSTHARTHAPHTCPVPVPQVHTLHTCPHSGHVHASYQPRPPHAISTRPTHLGREMAAPSGNTRLHATAHMS